ncbi:universal stress protein [Dyadobacter sp. LHD-138]|uniref:universal stress protein n=1 Tax=Dyadobacter sp. LHD-138 TaxID=3071413 RepID=UPI0027E1165B|nr:universal stress protein [Dyadobacter sp. LHD-138]MDQ6477206.1 universal stress protein [Dyadobacter sp. LHD-138]
MKAILILTDFSENAFRAAEYVCALAGPLRVDRVVLYHVYQTVIVGTDMPATLDGNQIYTDSMQQLRLIRDRLKPMLGSQVRIDLIAEDAHLSDRINPFCREQAIDIVVMGISGKSAIEKLLLGSTTTSIQRTSEFPVLMVPGDAGVGKPLGSIMFSADLHGDLPTETANQLLELLGAFNADLHVAHVESDEEEKLSDQKRGLLSNLRSKLAGYNPNFHFVQGEDIPDRILALSHEFHASMIVTIHRQHGFFSSLFRQRISKKLIYDSPIPLLSLPDLS